MRSFSIIVAVDKELGIGAQGRLPWHLPADMKHFKDITMKTSLSSKKNAVIMGRKTWESLSEKYRPLPGRINVVLTRNPDFTVPAGVIKSKDLRESLEILDQAPWKEGIENIFVIGGGEVYNQAVADRACERIYVTKINKTFNCEVFFPHFEPDFKLSLESPPFTENSLEYRFQVHIRK